MLKLLHVINEVGRDTGCEHRLTVDGVEGVRLIGAGGLLMMCGCMTNAAILVRRIVSSGLQLVWGFL